jgi:SAM-dependent methyltransferase
MTSGRPQNAGGWEERILPGVSPSQTLSEHLARYEVASRFGPGRILGAACGVGYGTALLHEAGARQVIGVDISIEACRHGLKAYGASVVCGDATTLPFASEIFDLVVSFETVEHVSDPAQLLSELNRVCKTNGMLITSVPNKRVYPPGNPFHLHEFGRGDILRLIERNGFTANTIMGQAFRPYPAVLARRAVVRCVPGLRRIAKLWRAFRRRRARLIGSQPGGDTPRWDGRPQSPHRGVVPEQIKAIRGSSWLRAPTYFIVIATKRKRVSNEAERSRATAKPGVA